MTIFNPIIGPYGQRKDVNTESYVVVDSDLEPHRYIKTISLLMTGEQAKAIADELYRFVDSSVAGISVRTGKSKKGNPVTGEDAYE